MGQALYRKWRPQTFDDVMGQEHIVRTLRNALRQGRIHHAYLLAGPRGTGKTTTARLLAKAVNCLAPVEQRPCNACTICQAVNEGRLMDLIEIDAASNTGVDNVRELLEKVGFRPAQARLKVYVIDEVHMLSTAAFNALLKTLEEPPEHVLFVLATTEAHKIPPTVLSRCQRFEFRRIPLTVLVERMAQIARTEGIQAEPEALDLIARAATGSFRDALSLLDQLAAEGTVTADMVRQILGAERRDVVQALARAWLAHDLEGGLHTINRAVDGGADPRQLARQTADLLRGLLLMRLGAGDTWTDPTAEERPLLQELARSADPERLVEAVRRFSQVAAESRTGWQPQLPLELAFVEVALEQSPAAPVAPPPQRPPAVTPSTRPPEQRPPAETARPASPPARTPAADRQPSPPPAPAKQPVTPTPVAPTAPPTATGSGTLPVEDILKSWRDIVATVQPVNLAALLRDARPLGVESDGVLVIGFKYPFHRDKVNDEANRRALEEALARKFRQPIRVRCVLEKEWTPPPVPASRPAAPLTPPEEPPNDPLADDLVQRAVTQLGAQPKVVSG